MTIILLVLFVVSLVLNVWLIGHFDVVGRARQKYKRELKLKSLQPQKYSIGRHNPIAFFLNHSSVINLASLGTNSAPEIPPQLIIKPGKYNFGGKTYDFTSQGLYRIVVPEQCNLQRIVFDGDLDSLLSSICWIVTHGISDDSLSNEELTRKAANNKLILSCGNVSRWAMHLLSEIGTRSRIVSGITLEPWNGFDDGHTMLEIYREDFQKWVLYDLDYNSYFCSKKDASPLSLIEFHKAVPNDEFETVALSVAFRSDVSNYVSSKGFNYSFLAEAIRANVNQWYRRVVQVPLIQDIESKKFLFMDLAHKNQIEAYADTYSYIPEEEFMSRFYGVSER